MIIDTQVNILVLSGNPKVPLHFSPGLLDTASETNESITSRQHLYWHPYQNLLFPPIQRHRYQWGSAGLKEPSSQLIERYHVCGASQLISSLRAGSRWTTSKRSVAASAKPRDDSSPDSYPPDRFTLLFAARECDSKVSLLAG